MHFLDIIADPNYEQVAGQSGEITTQDQALAIIEGWPEKDRYRLRFSCYSRTSDVRFWHYRVFRLKDAEEINNIYDREAIAKQQIAHGEDRPSLLALYERDKETLRKARERGL